MDERIRRLVLSRPIPERLIESLAAAPDIPPHEIEAWVRAGGRITNNGPRSRQAARYRGAHVAHPPSRLSRRELQAIRLLAAGRTPKEAAYRMGVAAKTFEGLLRTARYRLGRARTTERAVLVAAARGLVELPPEQRVRLTPQQSQALAMFWEGARQVEIARATAASSDAGSRRKAHAGNPLNAASLSAFALLGSRPRSQPMIVWRFGMPRVLANLSCESLPCGPSSLWSHAIRSGSGISRNSSKVTAT